MRNFDPDSGEQLPTYAAGNDKERQEAADRALFYAVVQMMEEMSLSLEEVIEAFDRRLKKLRVGNLRP